MGRSGKLELDDETGAKKSNGHHCSTRQLIVIVIVVVVMIVGVGCMAFFLRGRFRSDSDDEWKGRLTRNLIPENYQIYLKLYLYEEDLGANDRLYTFDGRVKITMACEIATDVITLHSKTITIRSYRLEDGTGNTVTVNDVTYEMKYDFVHFHVDVMLEIGQGYVLVIDYLGELFDDNVGLYRTSYTQSGETKWLAASQLQPTHARRVLPSFDEPDLRAVFTTEIEHRVDMVALTNGIEENETVSENGWRLTKYRATPVMPTYLLAFVIGYFNYTEKYSDKGVRFRVWSRPDKIEATRYALDIGINMTTYFESLFNISFELPKQDMIAASTKGGAMENWGLIIYSEKYLLFDSKIDTASDKQIVVTTVSHELAHQWFGNLVTCEWWNDLWLNEGLTSYLENLGIESAEPTWNIREQFPINRFKRVFETDSVGTSHPLIRVPVNSPDEILEMFNFITYYKGGAIARMLNNMLGEEVFVKGLRHYLEKHKKDSVETDDLWLALTEADRGIGNKDVKKIMDTWTLQMGHPVVDLQRINDHQLNASQEHFLVNPDVDVEDTYGDQGYLWYIYLTYTQKTDTNFEMPASTWIEKVPWALVTLSPTMGNDDWYLVNIKQYGFYRVNYDDENWARLSKQLVDDHTVFPIEIRAQLLNDAFSLARLGRVDYPTALNLTLFLVNEVEYVPWEAVLGFFKYISDMISRHPGYGHLERYMQHQILNLYNTFGWNDEPDTDPHLIQLNRVNAIETACKYHNPDCLKNASILYHQYMQNDGDNTEDRTGSEINPITPNLRKIVYCYGIQEGGQAEWDFGWKKFHDSDVDSEKRDWLKALSCSKTPWILNRFLGYSLNSTHLEMEYSSSVITYVSQNTIGRALAWDFLRNEWNKLYEYHGNDSYEVDIIMPSITENFNTELELEELIAFSADGKDLRYTYEETVVKTRTNIAWMKDYAMKVTRWLEGATRIVVGQ